MADTNPRIVNFDAVTVGHIEITKTHDGQPRTWKLRDDVPSEVMMRFFELGEAAQAEAPDGEHGDKQASAGALALANFRTAERVYLTVLTDIFCHTYPETTADELRTWFTFDQRKRLVDLFFSLAGIASNAPSNATPDGTSSGTPPATSLPATPANRATRRAKK